VPIITPINSANLKSGEWKVNPEIAWSLAEDKSPAGVGRTYNALQEHVINYCDTLEKSGKFSLTIWPYHAMLGGIGHALVAAVEEACFFHNIARASQTKFEIKGGNPLTENYSILRPEVLIGPKGNAIAQKNARFIRTLLTADRVIIAGQAKSHCVAWTIDDLLNEIKAVDPDLAKKVYLLEDCTSSVAVPNPKGGFFADFTDDADKAFARFAQEGMHLVKSTDPADTWPDFTM
jgi:nicotinamidase-related amidase